MVARVGMLAISLGALRVLVLASASFSGIAFYLEGHPPLWFLMLFLAVVFFCFGMLFGNFNAMAMEPLGHISGTAAAVIASVSTFISLGLGLSIGRSFDGTVLPLVYGFFVLGVVALGIVQRLAVLSRREISGDSSALSPSATP